MRVINENLNKQQVRDSGIELLKIIAIIMIVIQHVIQTLGAENLSISYQDYVLDITHATTNIQHFVLICMRSLGCLGNSIFFVCSAWFLLESIYCKKAILYGGGKLARINYYFNYYICDYSGKNIRQRCD